MWIKLNKLYLRLGLLFALLNSPVFILLLLFGPQGVALTYYVVLLKALAFNLLLCFIVPCALASLPKKLNLAFLATLLFVTSLYIAFLSFHWLAYQQQPGTQSLRAIMDTYGKESFEFLQLHQTDMIYALFPTVLAVLLAWYIFNLGKQYAESKPQQKLCLLALVLALLLGYFSYDRNHFVFNNPISYAVRASYDVLEDRLAYEKYLNMAPNPSGATLKESAKKPKVHIVIIGESATSKHMALYGYARETTPLMAKERRQLQRFQVQNVCSSAPLTQASLEHIMLGGKPLKFDASNHVPANLISTLEDVGYKTFWLSNQAGGTGLVALSSAWQQFADYSELLSKRDFDLGYVYDEVLLPAVQNALNDKAESKVIFVHLVGSHPDYKLRYPQKFNHWQSDDAVPETVPRRNEADFRQDVYNEYDNSILYTDFIVSSILDMAEKYQVASVTYFSDHGQNVGEKTPHIGHSFQKLRQGYEVPLLFWIDTEQVHYHDVNMSVLESNLNKPFSLKRLEFTLFDIFGLNQSADSRDDSLFSTQFKIKKRICDGMK